MTFMHTGKQCIYPEQMLDSNLAMDRNRIEYIGSLPHGQAVIAAALDPVTDHNGRNTALGLLEAINAPTDIVTANDLLYNLGR
jgi:hypothetical protein